MAYHRHQRFLIAAVAGLAAALLPASGWSARIMIGADAFSAIYIGLTLLYALRIDADTLRRHASEMDEGVWLLTLIAIGIVATSLTAIVLTLTAPDGVPAETRVLALAGVPLGWGMLHMVFAFHYAAAYFATEGEADPGGLDFGSEDQPGAWEFLYHAFTVGMTAQVSDVSVNRTGMRQLVLAHSLLSFFYNTVILALAVNAAVSAGR